MGDNLSETPSKNKLTLVRETPDFTSTNNNSEKEPSKPSIGATVIFEDAREVSKVPTSF
jgi:hypothetical protein